MNKTAIALALALIAPRLWPPTPRCRLRGRQCLQDQLGQSHNQHEQQPGRLGQWRQSGSPCTAGAGPAAGADGHGRERRLHRRVPRRSLAAHGDDDQASGVRRLRDRAEAAGVAEDQAAAQAEAGEACPEALRRVSAPTGQPYGQCPEVMNHRPGMRPRALSDRN